MAIRSAPLFITKGSVHNDQSAFQQFQRGDNSVIVKKVDIDHLLFPRGKMIQKIYQQLSILYSKNCQQILQLMIARLDMACQLNMVHQRQTMQPLFLGLKTIYSITIYNELKIVQPIYICHFHKIIMGKQLQLHNFNPLNSLNW